MLAFGGDPDKPPMRERNTASEAPLFPATPLCSQSAADACFLKVTFPKESQTFFAFYPKSPYCTNTGHFIC